MRNNMHILLVKLLVHGTSSSSGIRVTLTLVMMGGGAQSVPPIFICEINRKGNKIMHCVDFFFYLFTPYHN